VFYPFRPFQFELLHSENLSCSNDNVNGLSIYLMLIVTDMAITRFNELLWTKTSLLFLSAYENASDKVAVGAGVGAGVGVVGVEHARLTFIISRQFEALTAPWPLTSTAAEPLGA
jgi:hypothetical protein